MKKFILTTLLAALTIGSSFANDFRINSAAKENFKRDFKKVSQVQWHSYGDYSFAIFNQDGELVKAYYNQDGELYGTSKNLQVSDLPSTVKRGLAKSYANYVIIEAVKFEGVEETAFFITAKKDGEMVVLKSVGGALALSKRVKS